MSRPGRKRKNGARYPSGQLVRARGETPEQVAARMPHRRTFGALALDQRAESEVGRLELRGDISSTQRIAGEMFRRTRNRYMSTIEPPRISTGKAAGGFFLCEGDLCTREPFFCLCEARRAKYEAAVLALLRCGGRPVAITVQQVAVFDETCSNAMLPGLKSGLTALAYHFGLTSKVKWFQLPK